MTEQPPSAEALQIAQRKLAERPAPEGRPQLVLTPISVAGRVRCSCGGEQFFIATGDDVELGNPLDEPVNNIECVACHQMYLASFPSALAATAAPPASGNQVLQPYAGTIWRHQKRGTTYEMIGTAEVQAADALVEGQHAVVYRSTHDGKLWVRPDEEFFDGRFDRVTSFDLASTGEQPDKEEER